MVIMNDEAHHIHSGKTTSSEELVWRKFIKVLRRRLVERHKHDSGLFVQYDFSATPFLAVEVKGDSLNISSMTMI